MSLPNNVVMMLPTDNILHSEAQWLVCPTNAVGTMGAGLAKYFSLAIPNLLREYKKHCKLHEPIRMQHFVFDPPEFGARKVYCFHTKCDWREYSSLRTIQAGLKQLGHWLKTMSKELCLDSIAIPALGCGRGQLDWEEVLPLLIELASEVPAVAFYLYPPKE